MTKAQSSALLVDEENSASGNAESFETAAEEVRPPCEYPLLQERLVAYLNVMGVKETQRAQAIAADALSRASRKVAPGLQEELFRRALEDIQRHLDLALTKSLGLGLTSDSRAVSGARAALLMGQAFSTDLLLPIEQQTLNIEALRNELPQATPPETPLPMLEQRFSFFFDPSPLANSK